MNLPRRMVSICEAVLEGRPISEHERAYLQSKIHPERDHADQRAALDARDRLLCEAGDMLPAKWKISPRARTIHDKFAQYHDTLWLNGERLLDECPERHRGTMSEKFWQALRQHDAIPAQRTIREILAAGDCARQKKRA